MISRRDTLKMSAAAGLVAATPAFAAAGKLTYQTFPTDENGFFRVPVVLMGAKDAILVDGPFNYGHGMAIADAIKKAGKNLTTVIVTINDPDYYFGLKPIHEAFPNAKVVASQVTIDKIHSNLKAKLATWSPVLKQYGPATEADIVMPTAWKSPTFMLEGKTVQVVDTPGTGDRGRYVYVPSLNAVFGGVMVFSGLHLWTADSATTALRDAWIKGLDSISAKKPKVVVPGHEFDATGPMNLAAVAYTRKYLVDFNREEKKAKNAAELIAAMEKLYPNSKKADPFLEYGAKVSKGEMKWG